MKVKTTIAISFGAALLAGVAAPQTAQAQSPAPVKNFTTYGNGFAVGQTDYNVAATYNSALVTTATGTDDLERLYRQNGTNSSNGGLGPLTISIDPASPKQSVDTGNPLSGLADASQGSGGGIGFTIFSASDGGDATGTADAIAAQKLAAETIVDFDLNDSAAPYGDTLTGLGLTTVGTGDGREYYDVDFAYSTDGVTFTKFLTAQDSGADLPASGATDEFLQATGISIANVKVLQLIERPNIANPTNPYYLQGSAISEVDAFFTPSVAPAPEPSQAAVLGIGVFGLAALGLAARKRRANAL